MYKGNGTTKAFPLPPGADGGEVCWLGKGGAVRLTAGAGYEVKDGSAVFGTPPPEGVTVIFGPFQEAPSEPHTPKTRGVCAVVYSDGTVKEMDADPAELLAEAKRDLGEARALLRDAIAANERSETLWRHNTELARETLSSRLDKYREAVDESVRHAAAAARDGINDNIDRKLIEIRKKHKETVSAAGLIGEAVAAAKAELLRYTDRMEADVADGAREAGEAADEARRIRAEITGCLEEARNAAAAAGAEVTKAFGARAEAELEAIRSLRNALETEVKAAAERARSAADAALGEAKANLSEMRRGIRHMNSIERDVIARTDRAERRGS
jgi:hypothetical protein